VIDDHNATPLAILDDFGYVVRGIPADLSINSPDLLTNPTQKTERISATGQLFPVTWCAYY
jgi:hypothetical protein